MVTPRKLPLLQLTMSMAADSEFGIVGARIKTLRKRRNLSQEQLAELSGIHYKFLGGIERGSENPTLGVLARIAKALDVALAELFNYEAVSDADQMRDHFIDALERCSDIEIEILGRLCRALSRTNHS